MFLTGDLGSSALKKVCFPPYYLFSSVVTEQFLASRQALNTLHLFLMLSTLFKPGSTSRTCGRKSNQNRKTINSFNTFSKQFKLKKKNRFGKKIQEKVKMFNIWIKNTQIVHLEFIKYEHTTPPVCAPFVLLCIIRKNISCIKTFIYKSRVLNFLYRLKGRHAAHSCSLSTASMDAQPSRGRHSAYSPMSCKYSTG